MKPSWHRVFLTIVGIVIGASAIVLIASLVHGGRTFLVHANQEVSGDDVIEVHPEDPPPKDQAKTTRPLSRADVGALEGALPSASIAPESTRDTFAFRGAKRKRVAIVSASPNTLTLYRLKLARGRALEREDHGRRVCVIGHEVAEELLKEGGLGEHLVIDGRAFVIVGVLADKPMVGSTDSTYLWNRKVLVPEATYDAIYAPSHEVSRIYVRSTQRARARTTTTGILLARHLQVTNFALGKDQSGGTEETVLRVIQVLLVGAGGLALFASGVNVMNVMLVTVSERRREIGLRRAIGATPRDILGRFLLEAAALSTTGGAIGVAIGAALAWAIALLARRGLGHWELAIAPWSIALGLGLAVGVGVAFGVWPAWRASKTSPLEALRAE